MGAQPGGLPKVSVIMPVYNKEEHLEEALRSFAGQTIAGDCELICVDDGSTDGSMAVVERLCETGVVPNLRLVRQANQGPGPARNAGLDAAHGEFVAFLDADDLYPGPDVLEALCDAATEAGVDAAGGSIEWYKNGRRGRYAPPNKYFAGQVFERDGIVDWRDYQFEFGYYRFVYRRSLIEEAGLRFPALRRFQDPPFFVRALAAAGSFMGLRKLTYCYRSNPAAIGWNHQKAHDLIVGIMDIAEFACQNDLPQLLDHAAYRLCVDHNRTFRRQVVREEDLELLEEVMRAREQLRTCAARMGVDVSGHLARQTFVREAVRSVGELAKCRQELAAARDDTADLEAECDRLRDELARAARREEGLRAEVAAIKGSASFAAGRALTWAPRKLRDASKGKQ